MIYLCHFYLILSGYHIYVGMGCSKSVEMKKCLKLSDTWTNAASAVKWRPLLHHRTSVTNRAQPSYFLHFGSHFFERNETLWNSSLAVFGEAIISTQEIFSLKSDSSTLGGRSPGINEDCILQQLSWLISINLSYLQPFVLHLKFNWN